MTKNSEKGSLFDSVRFTDFATVQEALVSKDIGATMMVVPLAMKLRSEGLPIKIVYLGHRDGTALMVHKDSEIRDFGGLRGKKIAIPTRYSNQNILLHRMRKQWNMPASSMEVIELPPPEHPTALLSKSVDAYIVGEPFAAKAELDGFGRVLYLTKDIWPEFISCALVVHEDLIRDERELVQELVDGIAKSGKWLEQGTENRMQAAEVVGERYYFQPPALLKHVLSKPPDRVKYTNLAPARKDLDEIMDLAVEMGLIRKRLEFEEYVDDSFVRPLDEIDWNMQRLPEGT